MKKLLVLALCTTIFLISCSDYDFSGQEQIAIKENAEKIFGLIDPNQDWSSVNSGTITVKADAPLYDVKKVQILTESPFMNSNAKVLAEAEVSKGQTVSLTYDAPNIYDNLVAACLDGEGHYYIKSFDRNESSVSFGNSAAARTRAFTRSVNGYPDPNLIKVEYSRSIISYNAERAINNEGAWRNSGWENDRLWKVSKQGDIGNGWYIDNSNYDDAVPYREIADMSDNEKKELQAIFDNFLSRKDNNGKKISDNIERIRNSKQVSIYGNHLISDGSNPITLIPVMMPSTEIGNCDVYYYYYSDSEIPSGMSEADYIKTLPKFRTLKCSHSRNAASRSNINLETDFYKNFEYLLPYYGDNIEFTTHNVMASSFATVDPTIYRIRNEEAQQGEVYYMTYTGNTKQLETKYDDNDSNVAYQLWQKFTLADGRIMLYNLGTNSFMQWTNKTEFSNDYTNDASLTYIFSDKYIYTSDKEKVLKLNWNNGNPLISPDNNTKNSVRHWYFDEYTGNSVKAVTDVALTKSPKEIVAKSVIIPAGFKVGLMLRKSKGNESGCLYSYGPLNVEINSLPDGFGNYVNMYGMNADDTRTCMFNANGKTYITFEEGVDCNFSDIIIELGGYDTKVLSEAPSNTEPKSTGVDTDPLYDEEEIKGQAYMLCFEDRPTQADYDLNDVVLRCTRISETEVELSLIAAGAFDNVVIQGIPGEYEEGYKLNGREVHEIFRKQDAVDKERYINTLSGATFLSPKSAIYEIDKNMTIPQFLSKIYIENQTTGQTVEVAKTGSSPCGIIIPSDFDYPMEGESITGAYQLFTYWSRNASNYKDWYSKENSTDGTTITVNNVLKQNQ